MKLNELSPIPGSTRKRMRVGRGIGSGNGKTAGRGQKGQLSRSGGKLPAYFEGGQMPLARRLPKRGFHNIFAKNIVIVNLAAVEASDKFAAGSVVDGAALQQAGLIKKVGDGVKVLGSGELTRALTFRVRRVSASAKAKIEAAGGTVELI